MTEASPLSSIPVSPAERLQKLKSAIMDQWEIKSREAVKATLHKDSSTVRDELSKFLDELAMALQQGSLVSTERERQVAMLHGQQRASLRDYTLGEVVHEYSVLRRVLIENLENASPLSSREREIINQNIDYAIEVAAHEFFEVTQNQLREALAQSQRSNEDLEQFAAIVAHDLRSPLHSVMGYTELLVRDCTKAHMEKAQSYGQSILKAIHRMNSLIQEVLNFARITGMQISFEPVDTAEAVGAALMNLQSQIQQSKGEIHFADLPVVMGKLPLISQVFQNLISNSLKYHSDQPPLIRIKATDQGDFWLFQVEDNGIGFDPHSREDVFKLYKTLHKESGTGIGLASCRRVVELHGGKIWAESRIGLGSIFYFTLPKSVPVDPHLQPVETAKALSIQSPK